MRLSLSGTAAPADITWRVAPPPQPWQQQDRVEQVIPHSVLGITCPCQQQAAHIFTAYNNASWRGDIAEMAYRGQQARRGRATTRNEALMYAAFALPFVAIIVADLLDRKYAALWNLPGVLANGVNAGINIGNTLRYGELYARAKEELAAAVGGEAHAARVLAITAKKGDVADLVNALEALGVDATRLVKTQGYFSPPAVQRF